jgi:DNA-binding LacI/PurR family transcriptional regulator
MNRKRITIADVAAAAGVSMMTVSRAVNGRDGINAETRERILKIAADLRYRPNHIARGLVTRQTATLGLVMPDVANPFFAQIARSAEDIAYQNGYALFLINTGEDIDREKNALDSLLEKEIDGAILCSSRLSQTEMITYLEVLPATVLVNRELDVPEVNGASLNVDDKRGIQLAVDYLVKQGRTHIAFAVGPSSSVSSQRRLEGYHAGLEEHGLAFNIERVVNCPPTTQGGEEAAVDLLNCCPEVDAILSFNDLVAVGVTRACLQAGRDVPQEIAVIGADDIPLAALTNPSLTTLHVDLNKLGEQAMLALLRLINAPDESAQKITLEPELVIRQSA